jgi:hypothetical protein
MTDPHATAGGASRKVVSSVLAYGAVQGTIVVGAAVLLQRFVWTDPASVASITASAWLAVVVQLIAFAIMRLVARQQVIAAWGLGVVVRAGVVAFWALLGIKAFGLVSGPALMSLVLFFFVSTLLEPIFLNMG